MPKFPRALRWIIPCSVVVLFLAALAIGSLWIKSYLRSDAFRQLIADKTGEAVKGTANYEPLRWIGASVFSNQLTIAGQQGSPLASLSADQLRATVAWRAIFDGAWRIENLEAARVLATFRPGSFAQEPSSAHFSSPEPAIAKWLPHRFEIGSVSTPLASIRFLDAADKERFALNESSLRMKPDSASWLLEGQGGTFLAAGFPQMKVESFRSRIHKDVFFLTDSQLRLGDSGHVAVSGEFSKTAKVRVTWDRVNIDPFLAPHWRKKLSATMAGSADITVPDGQTATATGKFTMTDGLVQKVPLLDQIAKFTGAPQFRRMPVQEISSDFSWQNGILTLTNFIGESKGLLRLEGTCTIGADHQIDGTFRIGVTPQTVQWLPGSREKVFTEAGEGYLWTSLKIGGTMENPTEDLSARLLVAMGEQVIEQGTKAIDNLPAPAREGAKQALDLLKPFFQ
ncbi:MAG: hypothetical protein BGO12_10460 [Verrucomicrobia bacterium 61-8]|nr:hypothetical protein [Verrucomicrobiota bacterium]OJV26195.1 MAG: hypothetical protein BGO12_10460 [Verrucomicrobia bacterium 61-8]